MKAVFASQSWISSPGPALLRAALAAAALWFAAMSLAAPVSAASRIKDIADFEGVRENLLVGYGLVVGLNGTGDTLSKSPFTQQSLVAMLERLGVNTRDNVTKLDTKNIAAVMVTATLKPFARQGTRLDITVNAMGDSKSLQGGTLLVTLLGADGEVYAVAQGPRSPSAASPRRAKPSRSPRERRRPAASPTAPSSSARSASILPI